MACHHASDTPPSQRWPSRFSPRRLTHLERLLWGRHRGHARARQLGAVALAWPWHAHRRGNTGRTWPRGGWLRGSRGQGRRTRRRPLAADQLGLRPCRCGGPRRRQRGGRAAPLGGVGARPRTPAPPDGSPPPGLWCLALPAPSREMPLVALGWPIARARSWVLRENWAAPRSPRSVDDLTPHELQVARIAASGLPIACPGSVYRPSVRICQVTRSNTSSTTGSRRSATV